MKRFITILASLVMFLGASLIYLSFRTSSVYADTAPSFIRTIGAGKKNNQLWNPGPIATDTDGNVYIADNIITRLVSMIGTAIF